MPGNTPPASPMGLTGQTVPLPPMGGLLQNASLQPEPTSGITSLGVPAPMGGVQGHFIGTGAPLTPMGMPNANPWATSPPDQQGYDAPMAGSGLQEGLTDGSYGSPKAFGPVSDGASNSPAVHSNGPASDGTNDRRGSGPVTYGLNEPLHSLSSRRRVR